MLGESHAALADGAGFAGTKTSSAGNGSDTLTGTAQAVTAERDAPTFRTGRTQLRRSPA